MCRSKRRLLNLRKVVLRIAVEFKNTHFNQRILRMPPDLRNIERILIMILRLLLAVMICTYSV